MSIKPNLTSHVKINAMGRSRDGGLFLKLVITAGGQRRLELFSLRDAEKSSREALANLDANLITEEARREFLRRVQEASGTMRPTFPVITRAGWAGTAFVFPDGTFLPSNANLAVCLPREHRPYGSKFGSRGTLKDWQRIPDLARGNSRLMLAVALAFVGPVADLLMVETPMIQIFGAPGAGKTAIAAAAGSVWGGDGDELFVESWNHTANNLELVASAHHAAFLVLDETRLSDQSQPRPSGTFFSAVMRLAEGRTKGRLNETAAPLRSRTPILSTSNKSLDELALDNRVQIDDAYRGRLIDVPLPVSGMGAFEELHDFQDHHALAVELISLARGSYGVASEEFASRFAAARERNDKALRTFLVDGTERFVRVAAKRFASPERDLGRIDRKLATIFASARLAIRFGILPWTANELGAALIACQEAHVAYVRHASDAATTAAREADPLGRLRAHLRDEAHRLVDLRQGLVDPTENHDHALCPGYINRRLDGTLECLFSDAKFTEIAGGKGPALRLKDELMRLGALLPDGRRPSTRRMIWARGEDRREQVIAVRASFFSRPRAEQRGQTRTGDGASNSPPT
jgi:Domain of unknown function (DUF927)